MFAPKTKILVIDDMAIMRKMVIKNLKDLGFTEITDAVDGEDAWKKIDIATPKFQLIISDWNMPKMMGIDLLKKVRADTRFEGIPFILLTAEAEQHQIVEAVKGEVSGYIVKPFTPNILKEKLEGVYQRVKGKK